MKRILGLAVVLLLVGCASRTWVKDGATPETTANDLSACNRLAAAATRRDAQINQDILAARSRDWQNTGALFTVQQTYQASDQARSSDIISQCMIGKGYAPGG